MRITLDIDDDLLAVAKEMARRENTSAGRVVSRLLREVLNGAPSIPRAPGAARGHAVAGFKPFIGRGMAVTNEQVNALRDAQDV